MENNIENIKLLIVDDEVKICDLVKTILSKMGYTVFTALNTETAMEAVKKERPNLVLLDIGMGAESGLDVLPKIKEFDKNIKVVMLTAMEDEENIRQSKSLGADDYMVKPLTADYLKNVIYQKLSYMIGRQKDKK
ncbi:MAG: response regulator [Candidatus Omnitrophica bacterium]|nr:response regulator [Candidatus Omnitrophota bacterium]